ncbi:hypothetical protein HG530_010372 [Fusarium avenaceum]|nr:hypothetical protein HG530_010372 [Fusarium avenaceum]
MRLGNVGKSFDEHGAAVKRLNSLDGLGATAVGDDLLVQLVERLDMVGGEGDRDEHKVLLALGNVVLYAV